MAVNLAQKPACLRGTGRQQKFQNEPQQTKAAKGNISNQQQAKAANKRHFYDTPIQQQSLIHSSRAKRTVFLVAAHHHWSIVVFFALSVGR
jgi:hypothetical protein